MATTCSTCLNTVVPMSDSCNLCNCNYSTEIAAGFMFPERAHGQYLGFYDGVRDDPLRQRRDGRLLSLQCSINIYSVSLSIASWHPGSSPNPRAPSCFSHEATHHATSTFDYFVHGWLSTMDRVCLVYTSPSPRDQRGSRMPSSA